MTLYCGIDLHSNNHVVCVIDDQDQRVLEKKLDNDPELTLRTLSRYKRRLHAIAIESTFNWYWLADALMEAGYQVELVNGIPGTVYSTTRLPLCTENTTRGHHPDACGQQLVRYTVPGIYSSYLDRRIPAAGVPIE